MTITLEDVEHIARLARLELSEEEKIKFLKDLDSILTYMQQIHNVDTSHDEVLDRIIELPLVLREDIVTPSLSQAEALVNAPDKENGYFKVPRVIG